MATLALERTKPTTFCLAHMVLGREIGKTRGPTLLFVIESNATQSTDGWERGWRKRSFSSCFLLFERKDSLKDSLLQSVSLCPW